jgi:hypothetical protein
MKQEKVCLQELLGLLMGRRLAVGSAVPLISLGSLIDDNNIVSGFCSNYLILLVRYILRRRQQRQSAHVTARPYERFEPVGETSLR